MRIDRGTILIVDDEPDHSRLVRMLLSKTCPQLCTVTLESGMELISFLEGMGRPSSRNAPGGITLILLDLRMPDMNGFDVLLWLKEHPPHDRIPVVVLTACGEIDLIQRAYSLGARSFLAKPPRAHDFENMLQELQKWIQAERGQNPGAMALSGRCPPAQGPYPDGAKDQCL